MRYCLKPDGDGHYYCIPTKLKVEFEKELDWAGAQEDISVFSDKFDKYRIEGPHVLSFENPETEL